MDTSIGGFLALVAVIADIAKSGPQINKINRTSSPPPNNNLLNSPSSWPRTLGLLCASNRMQYGTK